MPFSRGSSQPRDQATSLHCRRSLAFELAGRPCNPCRTYQVWDGCWGASCSSFRQSLGVWLFFPREQRGEEVRSAKMMAKSRIQSLQQLSILRTPCDLVSLFPALPLNYILMEFLPVDFLFSPMIKLQKTFFVTMFIIAQVRGIVLGEALVSSCTSRCLPFSTIQQSQWEYFIYFVREELDRSPHQGVCQVLLPFSSLTDWSLPLCTYFYEIAANKLSLDSLWVFCPSLLETDSQI